MVTAIAKYSKNPSLSLICKGIVAGKGSIADELRSGVHGRFMTCVLEGNYDAALSYADGDSRIALIKEFNQLSSAQNFHVFKCSHIHVTSHKPARMKIRSERFKQTVMLGWTDFESPHIEENCKQYLQEQGFNIVGVGEGEGCMYVFSDTFKPLITGGEK